MPKSIYLLLVLVFTSEAVHVDNWHPVLHSDLYDGIKTIHTSHPTGYSTHTFHQSSDSSSLHGSSNQCELYKVGFLQDLYFQYIQYKTHIPEMKEFTLCFWTKFANHSNDHPIFSYAVDGQPKAISSWISNTDRSSYFSLAVEGHTFYRLNYPLRINKWYHTCQSWNGKTGEWQIWVNAERVGRGFHNRLVGHVIPSGGLAITGQQQTQLGGGFQEGKDAPKGSGGMLGQITMVQLYKVALTAGKAHRDHKHHHAHQYDHNGNQITTPAPVTPRPRSNVPSHPLLTGGQINHMLMLNLAGGQQQPQIVPGQQFSAQLVNGQFVNNLVSQQLSQQQPQFAGTPLLSSGLVHPSLVNPANVQFIDTPIDTHQLFKREQKEPKFGDKLEKKAESDDKENKHKKRELYLGGGTIIEEGFHVPSNFDHEFLDGLAGIGENSPILEEQKQNDEREPAEAEVKAVMNVCNGCDEEPFEKALVFGWRTVPKKLYSGAFYSPAVPQCKAF
ncbi:uncharacterized protein LOC123013625 [Tribolium madens]|uniref:uncharacterized protein LOC123013625 n=1 Tax=Tribolium madens TaxID=41895 RepID=UPI001CF75743|nr:uncharacterized protein LOC123013625 [Tribolium madens]